MAGLFVCLTLAAPARAQSGPDGGAVRLTEAEIEAMTVQPASGEEKPAAKSAATAEAPPVESAAGSGPVSGFSVDTSDRNAVVALYHEVYMASEGYEAIHGWTGNVGACNEGTTSHDLKEDVRRRVNYYRAMVGLPANITFDATKSAKAQKAALIMSHEASLSHDPQNDFPTNPCLSADGQEAAENGNLALGSYGPGAIDGLMEDDGGNNAVVGHRRWILYSRAQEMGTGDIPIEEGPGIPYRQANCLWVIGDFLPAPATPPQIAWPPAGFVPYHLVPNSSAAFPRWSFSYPGANFSSATVTMTQGATNIPVVKETVASGYGDNTLVWRPGGIPSTPPDADTTYTVNITGISGAPLTSRTYQVTLIDPYRLNAEADVSGPAAPGAGVANTYQFTPIANASEYEAAISSYSSAAWAEGAEASPTPRVIDGTDAAYALLSTHTRATGSRAFHLCTPSFDPTEHFTIDRDLVPQTGSQVQFKYRRLFMYPDTKLRVQLSRDGGQSFKTIGTISGNNTSGSSSQWDTASFLSAAFPVPAEFLDRVIRVRFLMDPTDITYTGTDNNNGIYLDDITLTNTLNLTGSTTSTLGSGATSFTYTPGAIGENRILTVNPKLGGRFWGGGEVFFTSAVAPGVTLSVGDVSVSEAAGPATFTITLSQIQPGAVTVDYATADVTATAGDDYTTTTGTATIPAGLTSATVPVALVNDAVFESDETFQLILSNASPGAVITDGTGVATITNDDTPPQIDIADASAGEGAAAVAFTVSLSTPVPVDVSVTASTSDGTARGGGVDFATVSRILTIPAGQNAATLSVPLREDALFEADETFVVTLSSPSGTVIGDATATGTIHDDDAAAMTHSLPGAAPAVPPMADATFDVAALGRFGGLLVDPVDATVHPGAIPSFVLSTNGVFSGLILFGNERLPLRGTLASDGSYSGTIPRVGGSPATVNLQLKQTTTGTPGYRIGGSVEVGGVTANVDLVRAAFSKLNPTAKAGLYTLLIPDAAGSLPTEPDGDGYASLGIAPAGTVAAKGALGDGQPFAFASFLSTDGEFWIYAAPYGKIAGLVSGRIAFEDVNLVSDFHGPIRWSKGANAKATVYPGSFAVARTLIGSIYTPPAPGDRVLSSLPNQEANARTSLVGGNLAGGDTMKTVSWNALDVIRHYGPETLTAGVNRANGLVSGIYVDRTVPVAIRFGGVAFQKQQLVSGTFIGTAASGSLRVEPGAGFDRPSSSAGQPIVDAILPGAAATVPSDNPSSALAAAAGRFAGLLTENGGPAARGIIGPFVLGPTGAFSAPIFAFGERLSLKNVLNSSGAFTGVIARPGRSDVAVNLQLHQTTGGGYKIKGTLTADGVTVDVDAQRSSFSKTLTTLHAGLYTLLIPAVPGSPDTEPAGDGYATVAVSPTGAIVARGRLGDGTAFANAATLSLDGEWPLFALVYPKSIPAGFFGGRVTFRSLAGSDFDGQMTWSKEPNALDPLYPAGFDLTRWLIGSRFQAPAIGTRALTSLPEGFFNTRLSFAGGNIAATPFDRLLTWDARNAIVHYGPESFKGGFSPKSGLVSFVYRDPAQGLVLSAAGVVFQKQSQARGLFFGNNRVGNFVFEAR